jgi:hypothetical protein
MNALMESVPVHVCMFYLQKQISVKFDIVVCAEGGKKNLISIHSDPAKATLTLASLKWKLITLSLEKDYYMNPYT